MWNGGVKMLEQNKITIHLSGTHRCDNDKNQLNNFSAENEVQLQEEIDKEQKGFIKRLLLHFLTATVSACLLGGILGMTLMKLVETQTVLHQSQPGTQVEMLQYPGTTTEVVLEEKEMLFVQLGVYQSKKSMERFIDSLPAALADVFTYEKEGKYYALHDAYAQSDWTSETIKQRYQEWDIPVYIYEGKLSEKSVVGNAEQLRTQRESLLQLVNQVQKKESLTKEDMERFSEIFSLSGEINSEGYGLFLKEMRKLIKEGKSGEIDKSLLQQAFFLYYQWNEG